MSSIDALLSEIQARADAATPGPWKITANPDYYVMASHDFVARMILTGKNGKPWGQKDKQQVFEDMCFIGYSRTDIPRLVAALRVVLEIGAPYNYEELSSIEAALKGDTK